MAFFAHSLATNHQHTFRALPKLSCASGRENGLWRNFESTKCLKLSIRNFDVIDLARLSGFSNFKVALLKRDGRGVSENGLRGAKKARNSAIRSGVRRLFCVSCIEF